MNKDVDYRCDFYSLGVIFYQMMCGAPPFSHTDPSKLVYAHIAKQPTAPHEINPQIPLAISKIILRLLAKNADDRYQSTYGLKVDLEFCAQRLRQKGFIGDMEMPEVGKYDVHSTFQIYQKLYGREEEIQLLLQSFEEVTTGTVPSNLLLVSGRRFMTFIPTTTNNITSSCVEKKNSLLFMFFFFR